MKDSITLSLKGIELTIKSRGNRCVGKLLSALESVYGNSDNREVQIISRLLKEIVHQEFRDLKSLLCEEHSVLFSIYDEK